MTPPMKRVMALNLEDQERIVRNEERLKASEPVTRVSQIPGLPFGSMQELWQGRAGRRLFVVTDVFPAGELEAFASKREVLTNAFISYLAAPVALGFVVAALFRSEFYLLLGVLTTLIGMFAGRVLLIPAIVVGVLALVFHWGGTVMAIIIGFFVGGAIGFTMRLHASMVIEQIALSSETVFCYLFRRGIIGVIDKSSGKKVRLPLDLGGIRNLVSSAKPRS